MDPVLGAVLAVVMRWVHIISVITLLGGMIYARYVLAPALSGLPDPAKGDLLARTAAAFRSVILLTILTILVSGLYNLITKANVPHGYHMWFGVKMLLVLHIFAVSFLLARSSVSEEKRNRLMTGVVMSGIVVTALSAWLRYLTNWFQS
jgi:uncharacterized membrane protein